MWHPSAASSIAVGLVFSLDLPNNLHYLVTTSHSKLVGINEEEEEVRQLTHTGMVAPDVCMRRRV